MREEIRDLKPTSSWPKMVVKKLLNMKGSTDEYHSDYKTRAVQRRRKSCSDDGLYVVVPAEFPEDWFMETRVGVEDPSFNQLTSSSYTSLDLRMFVGTWNVGGKSPTDDRSNLVDWLRTNEPADIYVLGFQEIVPLNAGNVIGPEDCGPAAKWLSLIRQALNGNTTSPLKSKPTTRFSDLLALNQDKSTDSSPIDEYLEQHSKKRKHQYTLAACKQMVGVFLCVWVREDLNRHISSLNVSSIGTGIMGYLGNKGSISISMILHGSSFCFVCTHLASGEKEGASTRRNSDVMEILKRTKFNHRIHGRTAPPDGILDHDKIIWLGDLNYRLASSCCDTYELLEKNDWQSLLEKDELRIEQKAGRVFKDWKEGKIEFAPTYKYLANSDIYVAHAVTFKEKRRTPAWCDRILWKGKGLNQICYVRDESSFSDHRPVYSLFSVELNIPEIPKLKPISEIPSNGLESFTRKDQILLVTKTQSHIQSIPRFSITSQ